MRTLVCCLSMALTLTGCELLQQLLPHIIDNNTEPAPEVSETPNEQPYGHRYLALPGGRLLHSRDSLQMIDVSDPRSPRVESGVRGYSPRDQFFRIGNHVVTLGFESYEYTGERDDVPLPRAQSPVILNVDISDRTQLTVINQLPLHPNTERWSVQGRGQNGTAIYTLEFPYGQDVRMWVSRYELQHKQLVLTGQLELTGASATIDASADRILIGVTQYEVESRVLVIDGTGADMRIAYETIVPTDYRNPLGFTIDGELLRVAYVAGSDSWGADAVIDTFDLTKDAALGRIGQCERAWSNNEHIYQTGWQHQSYFDPTRYSKSERTLYMAEPEFNQVRLVTLDVVGNCPEDRMLEPGGGSHAFHVPDAERLLGLSRHNLYLLDTSADAVTPLLASAEVELFYYVYNTTRPIQVFNLEHPTTAVDGTAEPWLIAIPFYDDYSGITEAKFQLFSGSRQTLTARSTIPEFAAVGDVTVYDDTLVTMSSESIRTFDISDLNAPEELGKLNFSGVDPSLTFGAYGVHFQSAPLSGPPTGVEPETELQILRIDSPGELPVASWTVTRGSSWLKVEDLLVELSWTYTSAPLSPYLTVQVYDLSDPTQPRRAGATFSDEIRIGGTSYPFRLTYRVVGQALLIAQREQVDGEATGPWSVLRTIDFQDPDHPKISSTPFRFAGADFSSLNGLSSGTTYFHTVDGEDGLYTVLLDLEIPDVAEPDALTIPAPVQAATATVLYTAPLATAAEDLTVSRILWRNETPPSAAHTWPGRAFESIYADDGQYVYLTHAPRSDLPEGTEPQSDWTQLEILDAETLEPVGTPLAIDIEGKIEHLVEGRLLISTRGALLFVDVRDTAHPHAQAAVPFQRGWKLLSREGVLYVGSFSGPSYPIDLQNLQP